MTWSIQEGAHHKEYEGSDALKNIMVGILPRNAYLLLLNAGLYTY